MSPSESRSTIHCPSTCRQAGRQGRKSVSQVRQWQQLMHQQSDRLRTVLLMPPLPQQRPPPQPQPPPLPPLLSLHSTPHSPGRKGRRARSAAAPPAGFRAPPPARGSAPAPPRPGVTPRCPFAAGGGGGGGRGGRGRSIRATAERQVRQRGGGGEGRLPTLLHHFISCRQQHHTPTNPRTPPHCTPGPHLVALDEVGVAGKALGGRLGLGQQHVVVGEALQRYSGTAVRYSGSTAGQG